MTIITILVLLVVILATALYFQVRASRSQAGESQQLLDDYQKRVDELQKLLEDYHALEKNFDNVGQGYEQALLAFDKMEEEKQTMQSTIDALKKQTEDLNDSLRQATAGNRQQETPFAPEDNITIADLIEKAVCESGIRKNSDLRFTPEVDGDVRQMMLLTSEPHLVRALASLLGNAAKFTNKGNIRLTVVPEGLSLKFTVETPTIGGTGAQFALVLPI